MIEWILGDESSLVKVGWCVSAKGQVVRLLGRLVMSFMIYSSEDAHSLHVHTTDSSQKCLLQIFLDEGLVVFIFLVLPSCL